MGQGQKVGRGSAREKEGAGAAGLLWHAQCKRNFCVEFAATDGILKGALVNYVCAVPG